MHKRTKLLFVALVAVFASLLAAGGASASRAIEIRGGPNVTAESRLTFGGTERSAALQLICDITLLRTIGGSINKAANTQFGSLTGVRINRGRPLAPNCRHGSFIREGADIVPLTAPRTAGRHTEDGAGNLLYVVNWPLRYDSFQGTLPRIEGINFHIERTQFRLDLLEPFGGRVSCLYEGSSFGLIEVRADGTISAARAVSERTALTRIEGSGICPTRGTFEGTFTVRPTLTIALLA